MPALQNASNSVISSFLAKPAGEANGATLAGAPGKTTFLTGFLITAANPDRAAWGICSITGLAVQHAFILVESAESGACITVQFAEPVPARATNTPISVNIPAIKGGAATTVSAFGFQA